MKKQKLFMIAVMILLAAIVVGPFNLWGTKIESENYIENVYALDNDNFFITCYNMTGPEECVFVCLKCGWTTKPNDGSLGRVVGKCPICQHLYPDTVGQYNHNLQIVW